MNKFTSELLFAPPRAKSIVNEDMSLTNRERGNEAFRSTSSNINSSVAIKAMLDCNANGLFYKMMTTLSKRMMDRDTRGDGEKFIIYTNKLHS